MKARKLTRILSTVLSLAICTAVFSSCNADKREEKYKEAYELLASRNYDAAYALFVELGDYKDAAKEAAYFRYVPTAHHVDYIDGEETGTITYTVTLNEQNLPATVNRKYSDGDEHTCNITYNALGLMTLRECTDTDGETLSYEVTYDANGNIVSEKLTDTDGTVSKFDYTYNEKNQLVRVDADAIDYYDSYTCTYDEDGNIIRIVYEYEKGNYIEENIYNASGDILKITATNENGEVDSITDYEYDEKGRHVKTVYTRDGDFSGFRSITYNDKDQKIAEHASYAFGYEYTYGYEYDEHGNAVGVTYVDGDGYSDAVVSTYKLVYLPYEYTEDEWVAICDYTQCWDVNHP